MRSFPLVAVILVLAALAPAHAAGTDAPAAAVVIDTVANMHKAPNASTELVSQATLGMNVRIVAWEKNGGEDWYRIETPDTYQGWARASSLRVLSAGAKPYAAEGRVFEATSLFASIYAVEDVSERVPVILAPFGARLEAGECGERWCPVTLPCGAKGFVQKGDGDILDAAAPRRTLTPDETVALAKRFLGVPYLWGGKTARGIDCSGFAQLLYHRSGFDILRDARIQMSKSGLAEVAKGQERTRDLVFFGGRPDRITHVGMMINDHEFIHSTTHDKPMVQISDLRDPYWTKLHQGTRRPKE